MILSLVEAFPGKDSSGRSSSWQRCFGASGKEPSLAKVLPAGASLVEGKDSSLAEALPCIDSSLQRFFPAKVLPADFFSGKDSSLAKVFSVKALCWVADQAGEIMIMKGWTVVTQIYLIWNDIFVKIGSFG